MSDLARHDKLTERNGTFRRCHHRRRASGVELRAFCARAGLRTLLLEREKFPREKVCGDCINPSCWPVLRRLEVEHQVRALPHGKLRTVEFIGINRQSVAIALPEDAEIAMRRSLFDDLLMSRARELGAQIFEQTTVTELQPNEQLVGSCRHQTISNRAFSWRRMAETPPWRVCETCCRAWEGTRCLANTHSAPTRFRRTRRPAISTRGLLRPGTDWERRTECLSRRKTAFDREVEDLGGKRIWYRTRPQLAHDHSAHASRRGRQRKAVVSDRRCRARG